MADDGGSESTSETLSPWAASAANPAPAAAIPGQQQTGGLSVDDILTLLRQLGVSEIPQRQALADESQIRQTAQANASPSEAMSSLLPAIQEIRRKLRNTFRVAGKLGPSGGGQGERQQASALGDAGTQLQGLFAQYPAQGLGQLSSSLANFRPTTLAQLPQPVTTVQTVPNQFGDIAGAVKGLSQLKDFGSGLFNTGTGSGRPTSEIAPMTSTPVTTVPGEDWSQFLLAE